MAEGQPPAICRSVARMLFRWREARTGHRRAALDRIRQDRGLSVLTALAMAGFVGRRLRRRGDRRRLRCSAAATPSLWLSVLATAIVALAFEPVRRAGQDVRCPRALHQDRISPYQVLARFPATVTGSYPGRGTARAGWPKVLAEGTGTDRAEVWLTVHGRLELAANWPSGPDPTSPATRRTPCRPCRMPDRDAAGRSAWTARRLHPSSIEGQRHSLAVRERGELLGALTVVVRDGQELTPVEERLFAGLAAQSGLMLRVAGLRAELEQQLARLERRTVELRSGPTGSGHPAGRRATTAGAQHPRRRPAGGDRAAGQSAARPDPARPVAGAGRRAARRAGGGRQGRRSTTLTALSSGLYPRLLTEAGPVAALRAAVASGPIPVDLTADDVPRCPPRGGGGGLFLLPGGGAERHQTFGGDPDRHRHPPGRTDGADRYRADHHRRRARFRHRRAVPRRSGQHPRPDRIRQRHA